ncbi:hypothetical protein MASR2M66_18180 [Chloroflexota bacterium]
MKKIKFDPPHLFLNLALSVLVITGAALLFKFLTPRSETENQFLFGLSLRRLIFGGTLAFFWIVNLAALVLRVLKPASLQNWMKSKAQNWVPWALTLLYFTALVSITIWIAMLPPMLGLFKFLRSMRDQLDTLFFWLFLSCLVWIIYLRVKYADSIREKNTLIIVERFMVAAVLFLTVFFLYAHFAALIGWVNKGKYAFWDLLAGQIIQGRLYIPNPPYTHDLTLYKGNWYVPMPPLPGILMVPLAYWIGAENINASYFSIFFSALNGFLLFLILEELNHRKWIQISRLNIFILVSLFLFGTPHLYVGISGRGWYVSQILTVFFLALAVYAVLRSWSPWWVGALIGLAMMARPNGLMTWPFLFAIAMQLLKEKQGHFGWRDALLWSLKTALPVVVVVGALLTYNYLRFDNFLDFGYTTINGDADIVNKVQTWGMFNPYFIPHNLKVMLFEIPRWNPESRWSIEPSGAGMSIFLTTPALFYLFRRYPKDWWVIGAWGAVFMNIGLLSLYSSTGAHQFGYRYILDMIIPLMAILAIGLRKKISWVFTLLVILSIVINIYGADWFMNA